MAGIRPPQAYLALDMTDTAPLASLAADLTGGRTSGLRFLDDAGTLAIVLDVTGLAEAERQPLEDRLRDALLARAGVTSVRVAMTAEKKALTIIAVGSGKGGVGKSTLAANLAVALPQLGRASCRARVCTYVQISLVAV